jgi:hypothetical protein
MQSFCTHYVVDLSSNRLTFVHSRPARFDCSMSLFHSNWQSEICSRGYYLQMLPIQLRAFTHNQIIEFAVVPVIQVAKSFYFPVQVVQS